MVSPVDGSAILTNIGILAIVEYSLKGSVTVGGMEDVRYFSPEYLKEGSLTMKGDVYSFACLFLRMSIVSNSLHELSSYSQI